MELRVEIVRFVSVVACELMDAEGRKHTFIDKVPIFSLKSLDEKDAYPLPG
jgi:hypothetical protein